MTENRRRYPRLAGPFDGSWNGAAGIRECRVTDVNQGGCFIDAMGQPDVGSDVVVTVVLAGREFTLPGVVAHVDRIQGFGVAFGESDSRTALAAALETL
jgi:Tfp pilus assembly protein PilZ